MEVESRPAIVELDDEWVLVAQDLHERQTYQLSVRIARMAEQRVPVPIAIPLAFIIAGLVFIAIGILRPDALWETGKVVQGREWLGETGMSACFIVFGVLLGAAGGSGLRNRR